MVPKEIIKIVNDFLLAVRNSGVDINEAYIFGSYAKGTANQWSDIDIAITVPKFKDNKFKTTISLRNIALEIDLRIEPIVFEVKTFKKDNWVPLIYEIKTTGVPIKIAA